MQTTHKLTHTFTKIANAFSRRMVIGIVIFALAGMIASVSAIRLSAHRLLGTLATQRYIAPGGVNAGDCSNSGSPCLTLAYAISQSLATNDTINAAAGTYVLTSTVNVNVANLTIKGVSSATTIFQIAQSVGNAFSINAAGVTLTDLQVQKTDVTGVHELILVNANGDNFTLQNSLIQGPDPGTPWSVNGIVSRALVSATGGVTGLLIQNNSIKFLRQPAYFNPGTVGTVSNNNVSGTRGWVVDGATINFTGNTWGPPANQGADIALLASCNPADYPNLAALSNSNSNAFISGQFAGASSGFGTVYVDDDAAPGGNGSLATPYQTISDGVNGVLPNGTVNVAAGTYTQAGTIGLNKSVILQGPNSAISPNGGARVAEALITGSANPIMRISLPGNPVTIQGFKFDNTGVVDAYDPGLNITIRKNIYSNGTSNGAFYFLNAPPQLTIDDNRLTNAVTADNDAIFVAGNWNGTTGTVATITNNVIENTPADSSTGMNLSSVSGTISGNQFTKLRYYAILLANDSSSMTVSNNVFDGMVNPSPGTVPTWGAGVRTYTPAFTGPVNIKSNLFQNCYTGVGFRGVPNDAGANIGSNVHVNFNRFINNTYGISNGAAGALDAENNWWGCNYGPGATGAGCAATTNGIFNNGSGSVDANPWLTLTPNAVPTNVPAGTNSTLSAKLLINSDSVDTSGMAMFVPNGTPATFTQGTKGTVAPTTAMTFNGVANTTYTAGGVLGADSISMTIDGQTTSQALTVGVGSAAQLAFVQSPTNTPPNLTITPSVTVQLKDAFGNNLSQAGVSITVSLSTGTGTLSGTLTQLTNASGLATFNNLSINQSGVKQLTASSGVLTPAVSGNFTILPVLATVYVDDNWIGTPLGTDPDGAGPATVFGYDSFATIQGGVNGVATGGTVNVYAGTYVENVTVNKSVTLNGANAGIAGSAVRGAESIIRTNGNQVAVVGVTAANVTINGFTIDGDDPGVAGAALASGDESNVQYGVRPTGTVNNLTISNNIVKKVFIGLRGDVAGQGNVVNANWFDSIGNYDFGYAVSIRNNFYANVTNNKMTRAWTGIHINNHNGAGGPASFLITGNEIHSYAGGILYWLQFNQATGATISGNTITAEPSAVANNFGVLVVSNQDAINSTFTNNAISGHDYGVGLFNVPTSNTITLGATNSITGSKLAGVFLTDNLNFNPVGTTNFLAGGPGAASTVNITGLSITGNVNTGVKVEGLTNNQTLNLSGVTISGGVTGLLMTGTKTALTGNTLNNTAFSGQSGDYITLASSALDNLEINALAVTFNGLTGTAATLAQNIAIEDKIKHAIDDSSLGFIRVKTGQVFVTGNSFNTPNTTTPSIQRAIDVAASGETVNAGAGTYIEDININKTLVVCGAGPATTTISGAIGGAGSTVAITANNVEFKNFKVTREGNTAATWNDPNLNTGGLSIQGQSVTGANIHDNLFTQNRSGIDINNSNGHTVRNNVITDNRTGMIFRNQTDNLTVVENIITNNWTVGIVFLDGSGGTNSPVQTAVNCTFSNNNLSANWYGQIVDRQSGGSLLTPGTNLKNFSANWFGTNTPVITTANSAEPGYAAQIPNTVPGGSATAPGGQPDIAGPASANFDITPLLDVATDTNVETTPGRGTYGFQGSFSLLNVITTNAQTGATGRIQEGVNLVSVGGTVKAANGSYTESTNVNKAATLLGTPTISGTLTASVTGATLSPGYSPGIINSGSLSLAAGSIVNIELNGATAGSGYDQINVTGTVSLGGATLNTTSGFSPVPGTTFTIINNDGSDPVSGIFNGYPEGSTINIGGTPMKISYAGGTNNNDVVLTANSAPVASNNSATTNQNTPVTITLTATDVDGNNLTFMIVGSPSHGMLGSLSAPVCSGIPSTCTVMVTYTPMTGYAGPDSFTFKANDGNLNSNIATVSIAVAATVVFVDDNWIGLSNGTSVMFPGDPNPHVIGTDAFDTIQGGVSAVVAPGIVNVAPGTYNGPQILINKSLSLLGAGAATTIINGLAAAPPSAGLVHIETPLGDTGNVTVSGFTITNPGTGGGTKVAIFAKPLDPLTTATITNNKILGVNSGDNGIYSYRSRGAVVIDHNEITNVAFNGVLIEQPLNSTDVHHNTISVTGTSSSYFNMTYDSENITSLQRVADNTINGPNATAITFNTAPTFVSGPSRFGKYTNVQITNNVITQLAAARSGIALLNDTTDATGVLGAIENPVITGNSITGTDASTSNGIRFRGLVTNANIKSNNLRDTDRGFFGEVAGAGHSATGTQAHYNNIVSNLSGMLWNGPALISAENNWWGCNYGPGSGGAGCSGSANGASGNITTSPWLVLGITAVPNSIAVTGNSNLTADLTFNSANADTSGSGNIPNGTPAAFAGVLGTVSPTNTTTTSGKANSVYTNTSAGAASASTTVDQQTVSTPITINCQTITVNAPVVSTGMTGSLFSQTFTQSGAAGSATFSTISVLPAGITLSGAGLLSGTPTQTGTFPITVKVIDGNNCMGMVNYTLVISCGSITINPVTLSNPVSGIPYNQNLTTAGTNGSVTFSINSGSLPGGLNLSPGGLISGTTVASGSFTFEVKVTDGNGCMGFRTYTVTLGCPTITLSGLPGGTAGTPYNQTITASPSGGGYSFMSSGTLPTGLTLSSGGVLSGTPTTVGTFTFTVTATGFGNCTGSQNYSLVIACPTISLSPANLPGATVNSAYNQSISASPAGGNYTFAVTSGSLPAGLTLSSAGAISGAPTLSGTFNFRVTATGFGGCTGFRDYSIAVTCPTITLSPASLPGGSVGTSYNQTVAAAPAGSYAYSVSSGGLPTGLTLNPATGAITGTPTASGSFNFTITALVSGCTGSQAYSVTITCPTITLPASIAGATAGVAYSASITASPAGTYTYSLLTGSLPSGLTLNPSTGAITGTPTITGTYNFTIKASASGSCNGQQAYTLVVGCPTVTVNPASLPNGSTGTPYSQTLSASPATGSYTFIVSSGSLPTGLNLNAGTGVISGTPSVNGTYNFTITATGFGSCASAPKAYTIVIGGGGCPTITLPSSLPNGAVGQLYSNSVAASPADNYSYTVSAGSLPPGLTLFGSFGLIFGYPTAPGTYNFTITATLGSCTGSQAYTVVIGTGVVPAVLQEATVGKRYTQHFNPLGLAAGVNFSIASGKLPEGITLTATGALSGTPSEKGNFLFTLRAADAVNTGLNQVVLKVNDAATPVVSGSIVDPLNCTRSGSAVNVSATVSNTSGATQTATFTAALPAQLLALPGSCSTNVAGFNCSVTNASTVTATGTLANNQSVTITYQAQIADGVSAGAQVCVTSTASFAGAGSASVQACATLNCPTLGVGSQYPAASLMSDQKAGSVLIYNIYTSATDPTRQNTRLSITNTDTARSISVHLFFVDGSSCSVADSYLCLTANQTASFLASDLDPGTTGYVVAVATDANGCPTNFNFLIGDEYVKFASGHAANLAAEAIAALPGGLVACNTNSTTAAINFDGISYNTVPRVLAVDNVGSRADGNDTLLILNRIGGNLATGASTLGTVFGILYDDSESGLSFSVTGSCQLRNSLSNTFPRTTPRFENFIPAGRSGWLKVFSQSDIGLSGSVINFNPNAGTTAGAFNQGHNLHILTGTAAMSYTIPVFPPGC